MPGRGGSTALAREPEITSSTDGGVAVCTLAGWLDLASAPSIQRLLLRRIAEGPAAIVCDLSRVTAIDPVCAGLFGVLRHPSLGASGTRLLLCGARPSVRRVLMAGPAPAMRLVADLPTALALARAGRT
jgi:anti-anti-sigma factor